MIVWEAIIREGQSLQTWIDLRQQGIRFENTFTPIPLCCPARQSLLCGMMPDKHGGYWNYDAKLLDVKLFDEHCWTEDLNNSGYQMGYVGKWHVHPQKSPLDFGFENYVSIDDYNHWRKNLAVVPEYVDSGPTGFMGFNWFGGEDKARKENAQTHWLANEAIKLINSYSEKENPWHIRLDFPEPHLPCFPTQEFLDLYDLEKLKPWENFSDDMLDKPYAVRQQRMGWELEGKSWDEWKYYVWRYLAMVSQVDDAIGSVLNRLEESGLSENTIVIFTSDHGDACGSHGLLDKQYNLFDEIVRVPLIVRYPKNGTEGVVCNSYIMHAIDFGPTILELAGLKIPDNFQGKSFKSILENESHQDNWDYAFSTYNGQQFGLYSKRMIRDSKWKYIWNPTDRDELYDLENDPFELENLSGDESLIQVVKQYRSQMFKLFEKLEDPTVTNPMVRNQFLENRKI